MDAERKIIPWTIAGIVAILIGLGAGVWVASMGDASARSPNPVVHALAEAPSDALLLAVL